MPRHRIIYMGTPDFAVPPLQALLDGPDEVVLVVTNPDRPAGRGRKLQPPPVKALAESRGVPVIQPTRVRTPDFAALLASYQPDLAVVVAYGRILPQHVLDVPRLGCLNVHASPLPALRGASPINHAILDGLTETGVSIMHLDAGMDTGPVFATATTPVRPGETAGELHDRLMHLGPPLLMEVLAGLADGTARATPQDHDRATHAGMLRKEDGDLDWTQPADALTRRVLGLNPWPGAFTHLLAAEDPALVGLTLRVHRAAAAATPPGAAPAAPGEVVASPPGHLLVQTGDGLLSVLECQLPGRKALPIADFLRGNTLPPGTRLGRHAAPEPA